MHALLCGLLFWGQGGSGWRPVDAPRELFELRREALEQPGRALVAEGERLLREGPGREPAPLPSTAPRGTGRIFELVREPAGTVFIAAENGLFTSHVLAEASDRVRFEGEGLAGLDAEETFTSVDADPQRRIWATTRESLIVLDPTFFYGRRFASDELPAAGPYRVRVRGSHLLLATPEGVYARDLRAGPRPQVEHAVLSGDTDERGRYRYGGDISLHAEGTAAGGAELRYRLDGHHVWRELSDTYYFEQPEPGHHGIDVVALDRDLDRSEPVRLEFDVAKPQVLETRTILTLLALGSLLCLALFGLPFARDGGRARGAAKALVSGALAIAVILQVLAGIIPHAKGWPFVGFSMYTGVWNEGDISYAESLGAVAPGGWTFDMPVRAPGGAIDDPNQVLRPLIEQGEPAARAWYEAARREEPDFDIIGLQARAHRTRLMPYGAVEISPLILSHALWEQPR